MSHLATPPRTSPSTEAILDRPVMIIGCPRSGTTWLWKLLMCHPRICGTRESHFFLYFGPALDRYRQELQSARRNVGLPAYMTEDQLAELVRDMWRKVMRPMLEKKPGATLLLEKSPPHSWSVGHIQHVLPGTRFILTLRDSRAVSASLMAGWRDGWARKWAPKSARGAARWWKKHYCSALAGLQQLPADQWTICRHEHLAEDTRGELKRLLEFVGLTAADHELEDYVSRCAKSPEPQGFVRPGGPDKWKHELNWFQKQRVWWTTGKLMKQLGYNRAGDIIQSRPGR